MAGESVAELSVDVTAKESVTAVLQRLESQLDQTNSVAERLAKSLEARLGAGQNKAKSDALAHAQAMARLQSTSGDTAQAIRTLQVALEGVDRSSTAAIRAETQLIGLQKKLASEVHGTNQFLDAFKQGLFGFAAPVAAVQTGFDLLAAAAGRAKEGFDLRATLDEQRRGVGLLLDDVGKGNRVFTEAAAFGRRYGFTQKEMGEAAREAAPLIAQSSTAVEKQLEVLGRLASLNSKEGFSGAVFSTKELASGDITSLVERFNLSRDAAYEMRDAIRSGADVFEVLDAKLTSMNVTTAALENRMLGAAGASRTYAQAQEDLTLAMGSFAEGPGQKILTFLTNVTNGVTQAMTASEQANAAVRQAFSGAETFGEYQERITFVGEQLAQLGIQVQPLSEAQYNYAQSLVATGVAAEQAHQQALEFNNTLILIGDVQAKLRQDGQTSAQAIDALSFAMVRVGSSGAEGAAMVAGLTAMIKDNEIGADQATAALLAWEQGHLQAAQAAQLATINVDAERQAVAAASAEHDKQTAALVEQITKSQESEAASQKLAAVQNTLAQLGGAVHSGLMTAGAAALQMANQYGIAYAEALKLIQAQAQLGQVSKVTVQDGINQHTARLEAQGNAYKKIRDAQEQQTLSTGSVAQQQALLNTRLERAKNTYGQLSVEYIEAETALKRFNQQQDKATKSGGKGKGKGSGAVKLSDQQKLNNSLLADQEKFNDKFADAELDHATRLLEIQSDYAEKRKDAEDSLRQSLLDGGASFYDSLIEMDNQGAARQADAQYQAFLANELPQLAAEKGADVAEAYQDAYEKTLLDRAKRQADIEKAQQDGDGGRAEALRGVDAKYRQAEDARLARIKEGNDSIAAEHERQLQDEDRRYEEAQGKIAESVDRSADRKVLAAQRAGKAIDAEQLKLDQLAQTYDRIAPNRAGGTTATTAPTDDAAAAAAAPPPSGEAQAQAVRDEAVVAKLDELVGRLERAVKDAGRGVESAFKSGKGHINA